MKLNELTIKEAHDKLKAKEISSVELTTACLDRIDATDKELNAFISVFREDAIESAKEIDKKITSGEEVKPLMGIPCAIKDVILVKDKKNTCGSKILENYIASYDATVVSRLKEQGVVILGKTNCDEFAMGTSGENSAYGPAKNPYDLKRVPGGSSSGSAVSVAANQCIFSLGTDTGGSVRQPASFCNINGLKPTYGRVSRYGLSAMASSLDQCGVFSKTVEDSAWVLSVIGGTDEMDATCLTEDVPEFYNGMIPTVNGLKIGVIKQGFGEGIDEAVGRQVKGEINKFQELGAEVSEISLPNLDYALAVYYILMPCEVSSNLARYDGVRYGRRAKDETKDLLDAYMKSRAQGLGDEVKRRIMVGTHALSSGYYDAYYKKAQKARTLVINEFKKAFERYDILAMPTAPHVAFKLGEKVNDPLALYLEDILTVPANIAGLPGISIPCGFVKDMPVGMQLLGGYFKEGKLLEAAMAYESVSQWRGMKPIV